MHLFHNMNGIKALVFIALPYFVLLISCKPEPKIKGNFIIENLCDDEIIARSVVE